MVTYQNTFKCTVMTPDKLVFENEIYSLFITGDRGEYELLPYHYPVLGIIKESNIIVNWKQSIPVKAGVLRFFANDCIILIEQAEKYREKKKIKKDDDDVVVEDDSEGSVRKQF